MSWGPVERAGQAMSVWKGMAEELVGIVGQGMVEELVGIVGQGMVESVGKEIVLNVRLVELDRQGLGGKMWHVLMETASMLVVLVVSDYLFF